MSPTAVPLMEAPTASQLDILKSSILEHVQVVEPKVSKEASVLPCFSHCYRKAQDRLKAVALLWGKDQKSCKFVIELLIIYTVANFL